MCSECLAGPRPPSWPARRWSVPRTPFAGSGTAARKCCCGGRHQRPLSPRCRRPTWCSRSIRTALWPVLPRSPGPDDARWRSFAARNRLTRQLFGDVAGVRVRLLAEVHRPFEEVVVELDPDLAQRVTQLRIVADRDEAAVTADVDVFDAGPRQLLGLAFAADRASAIPGKREVRPEDPTAGQPLAAHRIFGGVDQPVDLRQLIHRLVADTAALRKRRTVTPLSRCRRGGPGRRGLVGAGIRARGRHRNQGPRRQGQRCHVMPHRYPHLLVITGCTVAAPPLGNHCTRGELWFLIESFRSGRGRYATVTRWSSRCCGISSGRIDGWSQR